MSRNYRCIGLVISMIKEYLQNDFFHAVAKRAAEYGCKLFVYHSSEDLKYDDPYSKGEGSVYSFIDYDQLDGMIILGESIKNRLIYDRIVEECKKRASPLSALISTQRAATTSNTAIPPHLKASSAM